MRTRSGKKKYGTLGLRSGLVRKASAIVKHMPLSQALPLVVSLVCGVHVARGGDLSSSVGAVWVLSKEQQGVRVYASNMDPVNIMDWRFNPWDVLNTTDPDVRWLFTTKNGTHVAHFSHLDVTVADATKALHRAAVAAGGFPEHIFSATAPSMFTYAKNKLPLKWEASSRLCDVTAAGVPVGGMVRVRFL
jgi:hypothetical protein